MANDIDLEGRCAVVTGGAQGFGKAIAERFVASGARVALSRAIEIDPAEQAPRQELANMLFDAQQYAKARPLLEGLLGRGGRPLHRHDRRGEGPPGLVGGLRAAGVPSFLANPSRPRYLLRWIRWVAVY